MLVRISRASHWSEPRPLRVSAACTARAAFSTQAAEWSNVFADSEVMSESGALSSAFSSNPADLDAELDDFDDSFGAEEREALTARPGMRVQTGTAMETDTRDRPAVPADEPCQSPTPQSLPAQHVLHSPTLQPPPPAVDAPGLPPDPEPQEPQHA